MAKTNGLEINEDEFCRLRMKDQMLLLYRNTQAIRCSLYSISFSQKVQYIAVATLASVVSYLLYTAISG